MPGRPALWPTALGLKAVGFLGLLVVAYYAAPYDNLFFLLIAFLSTLAALGAWWTADNVRRVRCAITDVESAPAGAATGHVVRIALSVRRPAFALRVRMTIAGRDQLVASVPLAGPTATGDASGGAALLGSLAGLPRGVHRASAAWLESTFPLGALRARRALPEVLSLDVVAWPRPAELPADRSRTAVLAALTGSALQGGDDLTPQSLRGWREGDALRDVHWRATARRGADRLVVRAHDGDGENGLEVALDRRCTADALERALSVVAALALRARDRDETLTLHSQAHVETYGNGHRSIDELLRYLAEATPLPSDAPPPPPTGHHVLRLPQPERADRRPPTEALHG
ncbi:MAG: DUF58 domain-containing protein [Planctomycetes bacterium]|nr:DUF58 domain-containing protein [Planctomycetota bacterium]